MNIDAKMSPAFQGLFQQHRYKIFYGGRGSGKSWAVAIALILMAYSPSLFNPLARSVRILCAREYQSSIKDSAKQLLEDQIKLMGLEDYFTITRDEICCRLNESKFIFKGFYPDPEKIKSVEGVDIMWIEEAVTISQKSIDIAFPTIRKDNSEIWITFNRRHTHDPIDKKFLSGDTPPPPGSFIRMVNYTDNPFFPAVNLPEVEHSKKHDPEKYRHIWLGHPLTITDEAVFKKWRIDGSIKVPDGEPLYYGGDWGFSVDPTALLRCWVSDAKREIYIDYEVCKVAVEIEDLPEFFQGVPDSKKWKIRADSARPEIISHMNKKGYKIVGAKKGKGSVEEGVTFLQSYTIVVHDRCRHLIDELSLYSYKKDKHTGDIMPILEDANNHCIDALRYALEQRRNKSTVMVDVI